MSERNIEVIQAIYAAFGKGDIPAVLAHVAEQTRWDFDVGPSPVPWHVPVTKKDEVRRFLAAFGENVLLSAFEPKDFIHSAEHVVAHIHISYTVRRTGKAVDMDQLHWWTIRDGKVTRLRHFEDTSAVLAAYEP